MESWEICSAFSQDKLYKIVMNLENIPARSDMENAYNDHCHMLMQKWLATDSRDLINQLREFAGQKDRRHLNLLQWSVRAVTRGGGMTGISFFNNKKAV